jgi:predicted alpha/beta superfamily hydrolase
MKKLLIIIICLGIIFALFTSLANASQKFVERSDVKVIVNGSTLQTTDVPLLASGSFMLPFRTLLVALGVPNQVPNITYDNQSKQININHQNMVLNLTVNSKSAQVNGKFVQLNVAPLINPRNGRVFVPVRFISENMNKSIVFDTQNKQIRITDKKVEQPNDGGITEPVYKPPSGVLTVTQADGRTISHNQFPSSQLNNGRTIRVYLPASYKTKPTMRYPVVYMHDGQNVIGLGGQFGSWKTDEAVNSLVTNNTIREVIIVGIDNTSNRANEYNYSGTGLLDRYGKFVAEEVVPYINHQYRTLKDPQHTTIIGSSYGGNAALYIGWKHNDVFGNAGIFSPTLVWNDYAFFKVLQNEIKNTKKPLKVAIYVGDSEKLDEDGNGLANYAEWAVQLAKLFIDNGWTVGKDLIYMIGEKSSHNEAAWAAHVDQPLRFFYGTNTSPTASSMYVKLSTPQIDTAGVIQNIWAFPYLVYNNGVRTIFPDAQLNTEALNVVNRSFDQLTLRNRSTTSAQTLVLVYRMNSLTATANLQIVGLPTNKVRVTVVVTAPLSSAQQIYMTGDFSSWGQNINADYILRRAADANGRARYVETFVMDKNRTIAFKFRAGTDWTFVEKKTDGTEVTNRELKTFTTDVTASYNVDRWATTP